MVWCILTRTQTACSCLPKVNIYSSTDGHVARSISKFEEAAYSARFRGDGKLLAAGSDKGVVKVTYSLN